MPNEEVREQNIEKVLSTAYESFLENGIERTTQATIAQKTGLSLRTVSRYFQSKDDMVVFVAKYALDKVKSNSGKVSVNLRDMNKSGIELLEMYFSYIKAGYLRNPGIYLLRVEFDIYFSRNKVFKNNIYNQVVTETNSRPMMRDIFSIGLEDKTIRCTQDIEMEMSLLCNTYLSYICALAIKTAAQMEADNIITQLDLFFERLLEQYKV